MQRLSAHTLAALPGAVARPSFDRLALRCGIVHLGLGAFARAHLAAVNDAALQASPAAERCAWGICGVSLRSPATRDALGPQQGLYTLAQRDASGQRLHVIGCLRECLVAPESPGAVLDLIASIDARIVSLTVTEKGYCHDPASGHLRFDHPDIAHDLNHPQAPRSAIGFIVRGLALRLAQGQGPLALMSLDNLPANGHTLRGLVLAFAGRVDTALADWIAGSCTFPNSMVDRIVPRTTPADVITVEQGLGLHDAWPVLAEPHLDWVVEDRFAAGRPDWTLGGARFVADAAPWEQLKLRMVNGAHSSIAYLSMLAGWATVDEAMAQPALRSHIRALLRDEVEPTLPALPGLDLSAYRERLIERFSNPALAHRTAQIAMDGSHKLPQRLLATVRDRLDAGQSIDRLALGMAAWLLHLRASDDQGRVFVVDDPQSAQLKACADAAAGLATDDQRAAHFAQHIPMLRGLAERSEFTRALAATLGILRHWGAAEALRRCSPE